MSIRFFNNTKFEDSFVIDFVKPHLFLLDTSKIESIEVCNGPANNFKITVFGIECVLLETLSDSNHKVTGKILWFYESSGEGMIRLLSGKSLHFYSCNVKGANSLYPELVSNIQFNEGDIIEATLTGDFYTLKELGLVDIKRKAV